MLTQPRIVLALVTAAAWAAADSPRAPAAPRDRTHDLKPGQVAEVEVAKGVVMKFCWVPAGEAQLGSPQAERDEVVKLLGRKKEPDYIRSEAPERRGKFKTSGFWLGKFEVTQAEWRAVTGANPSHFTPEQEDIKRAGIKDTDRFPVERVTWEECRDFLGKLNADAAAPKAMGKGKFVLPHEDQWEYACRGGKGNERPFYFGDACDGSQANCQGDHPFGTTKHGPRLDRPVPVGSYEKAAPHPWGLCDMHGNVQEWCANTSDGRLVAEGDHACRGGSWFESPGASRAAGIRHFARPDRRGDYLGLRVCFLPE